MLKFVIDGIFVGDIGALNRVDEIPNLGAIINLSGKNYARKPIIIDGVEYAAPTGVDVFDYAMPNQELLDIERPKTIVKLNTIADDIKELRDVGKTILIHCLDGKNKCMFATGYYLITKCGWSTAEAVRKLETLYFTEQQIVDDENDVKRLQQGDPDADPIEYTHEQLQAILKGRDERRERRCLNMLSFVKLLLSVK